MDLLLTVFLTLPCVSMTSPALPCFSMLFCGFFRFSSFFSCFSLLVLLFIAISVALCMLFWLCMLFPLSNCGHGKWPGLLDSYFFYEQLYSFFSSTEATIEKPRLHNKFTNRNPPWGISPSHSKVTHMEVGKATVSAVGVFVGTKISWGSRLP